MWCRQCQQDVPLLASSEEGKRCCPRCGVDLGIVPSKRKSAATTFAESPSNSPTFACAEIDDWHADAQLKQIERVLRIRKKNPRRQPSDRGGKRRRVDAAHKKTTHRRNSKPLDVKAKTSRIKASVSKPNPGIPSYLAWTAIFLGTGALLGGGISLGCAVLVNRADYWNFGLPFVAGGQIVLLVGLVLQLDRIWRDNRSAAAKLDEVDEELHDLKNTAALQDNSHCPTARDFYAHYAGGGNVQLLLSDLKSQLDLLAVKIGQDA